MTSNNRTSIFLCARVLTCTNTYREIYLRGIPKYSIHTYIHTYIHTEIRTDYRDTPYVGYLCNPFLVEWIWSKRKEKSSRVNGVRQSLRIESRRWPFFTHDFSLFADTTLLTPQGIECAPITYIQRVNLSEFFEKLPYTYTSKCKLCGRVVSNLKNHYLTHNPGNYVCPLCGCRRTRLDNLKGHIKQKHPEIQILQKSSGTVQTWTETCLYQFSPWYLPLLHGMPSVRAFTSTTVHSLKSQAQLSIVFNCEFSLWIHHVIYLSQ